MAERLRAKAAAAGGPLNSTWGTIRSTMPLVCLHRHIIWRANRVVFFFEPQFSGLNAYEWTPAGYRKTDFSAWIQPPDSEVWNLRAIPYGLPPLYGPQSL